MNTLIRSRSFGLPARRIPVGDEQPGHRVFRGDPGEAERVVRRLPQDRADRRCRSAARLALGRRAWRGRARSRSSPRCAPDRRSRPAAAPAAPASRPRDRVRRLARRFGRRSRRSARRSPASGNERLAAAATQQAVIENGHRKTLRAASRRRVIGSLVPGMEPLWKRRRIRNSSRPISPRCATASRRPRAPPAGRPTRSRWSRSARPTRRRRCAPRSPPGSASSARTGCRRRWRNSRSCAANFPISSCT